MKEEKILFYKNLKERVPFSRTTIWRLERENKFPKRRKFSGRVGWLASEVDAWIQASSEELIQ